MRLHRILAILAGDWQETLEIAILPLCATLLVPMSFYELYTTVVITAVSSFPVGERRKLTAQPSMSRSWVTPESEPSGVIRS